MGRAKALSVSGDVEVQEAIEHKLAAFGFEVLTCYSRPDCLRRLETEAFDVVVLDLELPGQHSLDLCRELVAKSRQGLIVLASASNAVEGIVSLELGADDFLVKPFDMRELAARAKAVLRRVRPSGSVAEGNVLCLGSLELDERGHLVRGPSRTVRLGSLECDLLGYLIRNAGRVCSREQLCGLLWGEGGEGYQRLTMHINSLRRKIEENPRHPERLLTVRGKGYKMVDGTGMLETREATLARRYRPQRPVLVPDRVRAGVGV
jgi:two-component system, OmpR family, response regulator RegX3